MIKVGGVSGFVVVRQGIARHDSLLRINLRLSDYREGTRPDTEPIGRRQHTRNSERVHRVSGTYGLCAEREGAAQLVRWNVQHVLK